MKCTYDSCKFVAVRTYSSFISILYTVRLYFLLPITRALNFFFLLICYTRTMLTHIVNLSDGKSFSIFTKPGKRLLKRYLLACIQKGGQSTQDSDYKQLLDEYNKRIAAYGKKNKELEDEYLALNKMLKKLQTMNKPNQENQSNTESANSQTMNTQNTQENQENQSNTESAEKTRDRFNKLGFRFRLNHYELTLIREKVNKNERDEKIIEDMIEYVSSKLHPQTLASNQENTKME